MTTAMNINEALLILTEAGLKPTMLPYRNYKMKGRPYTCAQIKAEARKILASKAA